MSRLAPLLPLAVAAACARPASPEAQAPDVTDLDTADLGAARGDAPAAGREASHSSPRVSLLTPMPDYRARAKRSAYRGARIDLDVVDADLHNVFRLLADAGGVNVVVADDVAGKVTLRLRAVPWDQALHVIARSKRLAVTVDDGLYLITREPVP